MRNVYSVQDRLKNIPYPDPTTQIQTDPIQITYTLPEYFFTTNDDVGSFNVGVWNDKEEQWEVDMIESIDKND